MRSLITGSNGFIGWYLAHALQQAGDEVFGLDRTPQTDAPIFHHYTVDIADERALTDVVGDIMPDCVWHLAAQSNIPTSFAAPHATMTSNVIGSLNLFSAVHKVVPEAIVISMGSSAEYGGGSSGKDSIDEDTPLVPSNPYGISKVAQGLCASLYARTYGLHSIHVRPFAVIGPRKQGDALSDFCRAVLAVEQGSATTVRTGNQATIRDFIDVRDCVQALQIIARRGSSEHVYNICNGTAATIGDLIHALQEVSSLEFTTEVEPARLRPSDDRRLVGNNERLIALGYQRRYSLEDTVAATYEYWQTHRTAVGT